MPARTKNSFIVDDDISTKHYAEILRKVGRGGYRRRPREKDSDSTLLKLVKGSELTQRQYIDQGV